ncbi:hypothetical protein GQ651_02320 [Alphaproteobacteria bacterium GH1-50]|uniref:Uncharacterized protein n=1 Tax=Kangsaoukella pontilimi TaxID=2691042 RepID=A0A7C9M8H3_9RHOB|nr:hypothetical protein [Kangsaoukella pontilimi]MXQ06673.1 hypothetical protein [Kangsaoukella pontilimi]
MMEILSEKRDVGLRVLPANTCLEHLASSDDTMTFLVGISSIGLYSAMLGAPVFSYVASVPGALSNPRISAPAKLLSDFGVHMMGSDRV